MSPKGSISGILAVYGFFDHYGGRMTVGQKLVEGKPMPAEHIMIFSLIKISMEELFLKSNIGQPFLRQPICSAENFQITFWAYGIGHNYEFRTQSAFSMISRHVHKLLDEIRPLMNRSW